jgi:hypothetical protein
MIKEWNNLPCEITDMADLKCFKTALSKHTNPNYKSDCPMFHFCTGFYGRILTQMKLGLSKLNHHLFLYNITDNPFCPSCLDSVEDVEHYFLKCSAYEDARLIFLTSLHLRLDNFCNLANASDQTKCDIILNGLSASRINNFELYKTVNNELFNIAKTYIAATKRFAKMT